MKPSTLKAQLKRAPKLTREGRADWILIAGGKPARTLTLGAACKLRAEVARLSLIESKSRCRAFPSGLEASLSATRGEGLVKQT